MLTSRSLALPVLAASVAVLALAAPSTAHAGRDFLPGIKKPVFTMSPAGLRNYCERWQGRFWRFGPRFGCDDIEREPWRHWRIDCLNRRCNIVRTHGGFGGGGGGLGKSGPPAGSNVGGGTTSRP